MQTAFVKNGPALYKDSSGSINNYTRDDRPDLLSGKQNIMIVESSPDADAPLLRFNLYNLLTRLSGTMGKKNFLVFKHNKYINIPTDTIAFFYVKYDTVIIVCFDKKEYAVNYSLEQLQELLTDHQFFRLNRQYLINFYAITEVEHYFARKLLVTLTVPVKEKLLVSKEKASSFLHWLENK